MVLRIDHSHGPNANNHNSGAFRTLITGSTRGGLNKLFGNNVDCDRSQSVYAESIYGSPNEFIMSMR